MGKKHLIVLDRDLLAGMAESQASQASSTARARPAGLDERREVLRRFGSTLTMSMSDIERGMVAMMSGSSNRSGGAPKTAPKPAAPSGSVVILEGLGTLVVDEDDVDVESLDGVVGLDVFPDQDVDAPDVSVSAATGGPWHLKQIGRQPPLSGTGDGILVGVLDTGIDSTHQEFTGKTVHFQEFDGVGRRVAGPTRDAGQHGTHVSGLIAGATCGVARDADLAVAAVLTTPTSRGLTGSLVQVFNGLNWLLTHPFRPDRVGVDVVNASLGGGHNLYLRGAIQNALAVPAVLVIASVGNSGRLGKGNCGSPGDYPEVVGVGATDRADVVADFSDWDDPWPKPDLCAPGQDVYSSVPGSAYALMSGTSMASPITCGIAAVLLGQNPHFVGAPASLRAALEGTASVPWVKGRTYGNLGGRGRVRV